MKKDVINSMIIGLLTTYLPIFDISGATEHLLGMLAIGIAVLAFTIWLEEKMSHRAATHKAQTN